MISNLHNASAETPLRQDRDSGMGSPQAHAHAVARQRASVPSARVASVGVGVLCDSNSGSFPGANGKQAVDTQRGSP